MSESVQGKVMVPVVRCMYQSACDVRRFAVSILLDRRCIVFLGRVTEDALRDDIAGRPIPLKMLALESQVSPLLKLLVAPT